MRQGFLEGVERGGVVELGQGPVEPGFGGFKGLAVVAIDFAILLALLLIGHAARLQPVQEIAQLAQHLLGVVEQFAGVRADAAHYAGTRPAALLSGPGPAVLSGLAGDDSISGGDGNDVMWVGRGADAEYGGPGDDVLHALADDNQLDIVDCGPGYDVAWLSPAGKGDGASGATAATKAVSGGAGIIDGGPPAGGPSAAPGCSPSQAASRPWAARPTPRTSSTARASRPSRSPSAS